MNRRALAAMLSLAACRRADAPSPPVARDRPAVSEGRAILGALRFSPDGDALVATAVPERAPHHHSVILWDLRAGTLRWSLPLRAPGTPETSLHVALPARWTPDGRGIVAYWSTPGQVGIVRASDGALLAHTPVTGFGHSVPFGTGALVGDPAGAQVIRLPDGAPGARLDPPPAGAFFAVVSDDNRRAALPGEDGLGVWDLSTGARVAVLHTDTASTRLSISRDGSRVAEIRDGQLRVYALDAPAPVFSAAAVDTPHIALSPDGARVAVCGDLRGGLTVFDLASRAVLRALPDLRCQGIDWRPDGRVLALGRYDGVELLRVSDGARRALSLTRDDAGWRAAPLPPGERAAFSAAP